MSRRNDAAYLLDMHQAAQEAIQLAEGCSFQEYCGDLMRRRALERTIQIIGEAAFKTSPATRELHPEIPWPQIIGLRHRLVHDYENIVHERMWQVITVHVAELAKLLEPIVSSPPPDMEPES